MKTILIINNNSVGVINASKFAFFIAQQVHANIVLANTFELNSSFAEKAIAGNAGNYHEYSITTDLAEYLDTLNNRPNDFEPVINEVDTSEMDEIQLAHMINQQNIWMIIKSAPNASEIGTHGELNFNTILNKVMCPLLLVPEIWSLKNVERLVYITDLRYCRLQIVRHLAVMAKMWHADLSVAHLSEEGLVEMNEDYAKNVFNDEVRCNVDCEQFFFNNIREKNLNTAVDVLINGLHNDMLVLAKSRYHFNQIIGPYVLNSLPSNITVPVLIFPS